MFIAGSGTPAALLQKTLRSAGWSGKVHQTHGVANNDFLRVCGADCEGALLPAGPVLVAEQLPDNNPVKASAMTYIKAYEAAHGKGSVSTFGAYAPGIPGVMLQAAVPAALKKAQPGTAEFRALRDALENMKEVPGPTACSTMGPNDHLGLDQRARWCRSRRAPEARPVSLLARSPGLRPGRPPFPISRST